MVIVYKRLDAVRERGQVGLKVSVCGARVIGPSLIQEDILVAHVFEAEVLEQLDGVLDYRTVDLGLEGVP